MDLTIHPIETVEHEARILCSPATRRLVVQALDLASRYDRVDAIHDLELALAILAGREDRCIADDLLH